MRESNTQKSTRGRRGKAFIVSPGESVTAGTNVGASTTGRPQKKTSKRRLELSSDEDSASSTDVDMPETLDWCDGDKEGEKTGENKAEEGREETEGEEGRDETEAENEGEEGRQETEEVNIDEGAYVLVKFAGKNEIQTFTMLGERWMW